MMSSGDYICVCLCGGWALTSKARQVFCLVFVEVAGGDFGEQIRTVSFSNDAVFPTYCTVRSTLR